MLRRAGRRRLIRIGNLPGRHPSAGWGNMSLIYGRSRHPENMGPESPPGLPLQCNFLTVLWHAESGFFLVLGGGKGRSMPQYGSSVCGKPRRLFGAKRRFAVTFGKPVSPSHLAGETGREGCSDDMQHRMFDDGPYRQVPVSHRPDAFNQWRGSMRKR